MSEVLPDVLLNALRQYSFGGSPLWRIADGKDHVQIQVTFRKATDQQDRKRAGSRWKPTPSAGEWPRQPRPARRPTEILRDSATDIATYKENNTSSTSGDHSTTSTNREESPIVAAPVEDEEKGMETVNTYMQESPESLLKHYISKSVHGRYDDGTDLTIYQL